MKKVILSIVSGFLLGLLFGYLFSDFSVGQFLVMFFAGVGMVWMGLVLIATAADDKQPRSYPKNFYYHKNLEK